MIKGVYRIIAFFQITRIFQINHCESGDTLLEVWGQGEHRDPIVESNSLKRS